MKRNILFFISASYAVICFSKADVSVYSKPDFGTYQPILDRMPFGMAPDPSANPLLPSPDDLGKKRAQEMLARQVNMSAVNIMPDGRTAIGFTDLSSKPPVNYYLHVGESSDGWTVLEADYDEETALIKKDTVEVALKLGKGLIEPAMPPGLVRPPAFAAADQAVAAAMQLNNVVGVPPVTPGNTAFTMDRRGGGAPGLRREIMQGAQQGAIPTGRAAVAPASAHAANPSFIERREQRRQNEQLEKEEHDRRQQETLKRLAQAAADEAMRQRDREAAEAAGEDDTTEQ